MENISSKALAKEQKRVHSSTECPRQLLSGQVSALGRAVNWTQRVTAWLSASLGEHARPELCLRVSQDHTCVAWSLRSMNEMIDQDDWTRRPSPSHETTWKHSEGS